VRAPTLVVRPCFVALLVAICGVAGKKIALLQYVNFAILTLLVLMVLVVASLKLLHY
jgi:hypothetical protein